MSASPNSMKGGGYYSQNTQGAKHVIDRAGSHIMERLPPVDFPNTKRPFSIVDYGAADGGTSYGLVANIVAELRSCDTQREINVTYTDLPHNDFSALFRFLHDSESESRSYLYQFPRVYAMSSGTSFYQQILPSNTVDIGFSATAMHWTSTLPCNISDHVHAVGASGKEFEVFQAHALRDWETILLHRSREMVDGGLLVMANFCIDEDGRYLGNTDDVNMFSMFDALWKEMIDAGVITENEYQATTFPQFYKTIDEFRLPFDNPNSSVSKSGLRLVEAYTGITKCPYRAHYDQHGDAAVFADSYVPTLRSWSETVFMNALDTSRSIEERSEIVDQFFANYNQRVREEPENHSMDYVHTYMVITKNR